MIGINYVVLGWCKSFSSGCKCLHGRVYVQHFVRLPSTITVNLLLLTLTTPAYISHIIFHLHGNNSEFVSNTFVMLRGFCPSECQRGIIVFWQIVL